MLRSASRSGAVALTSAAALSLSALAIPTVAAANENSCALENVTYSVTGGTIEWGFKQSFRSYLTGPIAGGQWTLGGGTNFEGSTAGADGRFVWPVANGTVDEADSATATAVEGGTVHFYGHDGALDTTLSNPTVEINGTGGALKIDYTGYEFDTFGDTPVEISGTQVVAATFDLSEGANFHNAGQITVSSPTATIGDAFVPAFGMYPSGSAVDPITAVLDITSTCEAGPGDGGEPGDGEEPGDGDDDNNNNNNNNNNGGGSFGSLGNIFGSLDF